MVAIKSTNIWDLKPACKKKPKILTGKQKKALPRAKLPQASLHSKITQPIRPFKIFRIKYHNDEEEGAKKGG